MAKPIIRIKRSSTPGKKPNLEQLQPGELALNTSDIELYARRERVGFVPDLVRVGAGATVTNILYVTKDGDDDNTGKKLGDAKATIKSAVEESGPGTVIKVSAGIYLEENPIPLPEQVSVVGDSLREVTISPKNSNSDLFHVANGNYIAEMSYTGSLDSGKAIFAFNPNKIGYFNQSPYIQNCTNFIPNSIGLKVDGSHAIGPFKSMVLDSYTQYNQGGIGVSITNDGYAQLVSLFTICNDISVFCGSGGACDLTNSNSSFGNYALVADGVGPRKYTGVVVESDQNTNEFTIDLSTPTFNIIDAKYDHTTGILTAYTDQPHNFRIGIGISIAGLAFTCSSDDGNVQLEYPSGEYGYVFEPFIVAPGRYFDAYNSIQSNKQEIIDKSLASIALEYPNFNFPGDEVTTDRSRYFDAYRLIQKNKDVIVSTAFTSAVNNPDFSEFDFDSVMDKCKRDIGFFIDAISTDIFTGGNSYTTTFALFYFDSTGNLISEGIDGEVQETIFVFESARDLMKQAITNTLPDADYVDLNVTPDPSTGSNEDSNSCSDVQTNIDNLVQIVTLSISEGNISPLPTGSDLNTGIFDQSKLMSSVSPGGFKCARDISYFIDYISTDIRDFTNENTIESLKFYFKETGILDGSIENEINQTITAFQSSGSLMKLAINNQLNNQNFDLIPDPDTNSNNDENSCSNIKTYIDNLVGIVTTTIFNGDLNTFPLPSVSTGSTVFSAHVGTAPFEHYYVSGGTAKIDTIRPFSGQVIHFDRLYYTISSIKIINSGSGYTESPIVTIEPPETEWGISAQSIARIKNGSLSNIDLVSSGRGYRIPPKITISSPQIGINTARAIAELVPNYYVITEATPIVSGITTITLSENVPFFVGVGTGIPFYKQSRVLASGQSLEYIGSGINIEKALPKLGGVPIPENETDARNGGLIVYTSTDQSGNFKIGDGVIINQTTGSITGEFYSKSLFATMTPFILALGGD
jgi:hypothetical protein